MLRIINSPSKTNLINRKIINTALRYLGMILIAFFLFGIILLLSGKNPLQAYGDILHSALGSSYGFSEVLVVMTPMLITAVAVASPSRVGLINVGAEGQLYIGALFATWGALTFSNLPAWVLLPGMVMLGMLGGGLWAFIPGYLKSIGLVNETITSLLLNSVAPSIVSFFIFGFWHAPRDTNITANFVPSARLPAFFGTRVDLGFLFGLGLLVIFWLLMKYTRWGLEMRSIGGNPQSARRNGIPLQLYMVTIMVIGGAIAGLAGMAQVSGYYGLLLANFSNGLGFMGFLISWLAGGNPLAILLISFVVAVITTGGNLLQLTQGVPYAVINILLAFTLFIVLARPTFFSKGKTIMSLLAVLGVISSAIFSGTSLLYTTLGEVIHERAGIVNLGLEGVLLVSASFGFAVTKVTGNPYLGILAAALAGGLMNILFGYLVITRKANQLASGLAVMFFGFGLSALIGNPYVGAKINPLPRYVLPGLSNLPLVYTSLFKFDFLIFLVIPMALFVWWLLFRTRWGLGVRAVGENADTAFASGRNPQQIRYQALIVGGLLAGLGAAHLAIAYTMDWSEYMTAGRGFIAVALVIFSKWDPLRAIAGSLLFSAAVAFQLLLQSSGVNVSPFLLNTIPYLLTILVLIAWGGMRKQSAPASLGRVYEGSE